jgi:hypothetical protein
MPPATPPAGTQVSPPANDLGATPPVATGAQEVPEGQRAPRYFSAVPGTTRGTTPSLVSDINATGAKDLAHESAKLEEATAASQRALTLAQEHKSNIERIQVDDAVRDQAAQDRSQQFEQHVTKLTDQSDQLANRLATAPIDPDRYWHSRSTGEKIATVIGGALLGFGGQGATAINALQSHIDADISAQVHTANNIKAAIDTKSGIVNMLRARDHDLQYSDIVAHQSAYQGASALLDAKAAVAGAMDSNTYKSLKAGIDQKAQYWQNQAHEVQRKQAAAGAGMVYDTARNIWIPKAEFIKKTDAQEMEAQKHGYKMEEDAAKRAGTAGKVPLGVQRQLAQVEGAEGEISQAETDIRDMPEHNILARKAAALLPGSDVGLDKDKYDAIVALTGEIAGKMAKGGSADAPLAKELHDRMPAFGSVNYRERALTTVRQFHAFGKAQAKGIRDSVSGQGSQDSLEDTLRDQFAAEGQ